MMGLQSLPSEETVTKVQEARRLETQRRIEAERKAAQEAERKKGEDEQGKEEQKRRAQQQQQQSSTRNGPTELKLNQKDYVSEEGWKPFEIGQRPATQSEDPMVQQMNIIRGYIKQARQAQKWDEVLMLEDNLKELQQEYVRSRQEQHDAHS